MFTGLIETTGKVISLSRQASASRLTVEAPSISAEAAPGDSVAVNGACLTVTRIDGAGATFDLSPETLKRTTLGSLSAGAVVNLERALKVGDRLGGHFVAGHVDGVGRVKSVENAGNQWMFTFSAVEDLTALMIQKGSVAIDGISLTVVDPTAERFSVAVIPFTFEHTTLGQKRPGDMVNIETDMLARMVFKALGKEPSKGIDEQFLREHGFN